MISSLVLACCLAQAPPAPTVGEQLVAQGRRFLGVPYAFGGRMGTSRRGTPNLDCLGLVLAAAERVQRCGWRSFSYNPTELLATRTFGEAVAGVAPVASGQLDLARLEVGDVLLLVQSTPNPSEAAIGALDGRDVWVWHMGLYTGAGKWLVGDHFAGQVVEVELAAYLAEHADYYDGVFALRPKQVAPPKCRVHPPMPDDARGAAAVRPRPGLRSGRGVGEP